MQNNEEYDVVILGTGMKESILAAALARIGHKVLHLDQDFNYGEEWKTLSLNELEDWANGKVSKGFDYETPEEKERKSRGPQKIELLEKETFFEFSEAINPFRDITSKIHVPLKKEPVSSKKPSTADEDEIKEVDLVDRGKEQDTSPSLLPTWEEVMKKGRRYAIDLRPRLLFSNGDMIKLLVSSSVGRYIEFRNLEATLLETSRGLQQVPCSKGDIFSSKIVTVIEKRMLMKFLTFAMKYQENEDQWIENRQTPFLDYLKTQRLTQNLQQFIVYAIALVSENVFEGKYNLTTEEGLALVQRYLLSLGKYGPTPFLISSYGMSEICQSFCRLCAVFGGIYMLGQGIKSLIIDKGSNECHRLILNDPENTIIKSRYVVSSPLYVPQFTQKKKGIVVSRAIYITDKSILPQSEDATADGDDSSESDVYLCTVPAGTEFEDGFITQNSFSIQQLSKRSASTPEDNRFIVHITAAITIAPTENDDDDDNEDGRDDAIAKIGSHYLNMYPEETSTKPSVLYSCYFKQNLYDYGSKVNVNDNDTLPQNLYLLGGCDEFPDFKDCIAEVKTIFHSICPDEEFLPAAPDPEHIVHDDEETEQDKETNNNDNNDNQDNKDSDSSEDINQDTTTTTAATTATETTTATTTPPLPTDDSNNAKDSANSDSETQEPTSTTSITTNQASMESCKNTTTDQSPEE